MLAQRILYTIACNHCSIKIMMKLISVLLTLGLYLEGVSATKVKYNVRINGKPFTKLEASIHFGIGGKKLEIHGEGPELEEAFGLLSHTSGVRLEVGDNGSSKWQVVNGVKKVEKPSTLVNRVPYVSLKYDKIGEIMESKVENTAKETKIPSKTTSLDHLELESPIVDETENKYFIEFLDEISLNSDVSVTIDEERKIIQIVSQSLLEKVREATANQIYAAYQDFTFLRVQGPFKTSMKMATKLYGWEAVYGVKIVGSTISYDHLGEFEDDILTGLRVVGKKETIYLCTKTDLGGRVRLEIKQVFKGGAVNDEPVSEILKKIRGVDLEIPNDNDSQTYSSIKVTKEMVYDANAENASISLEATVAP